jgi:hypothetical protein
MNLASRDGDAMRDCCGHPAEGFVIWIAEALIEDELDYQGRRTHDRSEMADEPTGVHGSS